MTSMYPSISCPTALRQLDNQYKSSHGRYADDPKDLYQYSSNYPEMYPDVNFKDIQKYWDNLKTFRAPSMPTVILTSPNSVSYGKTSSPKGGKAFCMYYNSVNGCSQSYCKYEHISPAFCVTIYNAPKHINSPETLQGIISAMLDESEYFFIHTHPKKDNCYTIEFKSAKSQQIILQRLTFQFKDNTEVFFTSDTPKEAAGQLNYDSLRKFAWEWKDDDGKWYEYPSDFASKIESSKVGDNLQLKNPKTGTEYFVFKVNDYEGFQVRLQTHKKREIRRRLNQNSNYSSSFSNSMSSNNSNGSSLTYVWEYEKDDCTLSPIESDMMNKIENARVGEKMTIQSGKRWYEVEKISKDNAVQMNKQTLKKRIIHRREIKPKYIWEWKDADKIYKPYDSSVSDQIEQASTMTKTIVSIKNTKYEITKYNDWHGIQTNTTTQSIKSIRRRQA